MKAILLAGGRSVRTGTDKTLLELHGETLVERHVRQLRLAGVAEAVAVCSARNEAAIRARTGVRTVLQRGDSMSAAVLTGIEEAADEAVVAVCVNDIITDQDYRRILATESADGTILIPTIALEREFSGGYLELDAATSAVRGIVEKPEGGCPAGDPANIMIHQIRGRKLLDRLAALLRGGTEYETAVNRLIQEGVRVTAFRVRSWVAVKTREDIARAWEIAAQ
jgi:NDP-sugar pyrophosphorylase family protein